MSAFSRQEREGHVTTSARDAMRKLLFRHFGEQHYIMLRYDQIVMNKAIELLGQYPLRAYDSIQLATALISQQQLSIQNHTVIFTTADSRLEGIAQQTGLSTENPSRYS